MANNAISRQKFYKTFGVYGFKFLYGRIWTVPVSHISCMNNDTTGNIQRQLFFDMGLCQTKPE